MRKGPLRAGRPREERLDTEEEEEDRKTSSFDPRVTDISAHQDSRFHPNFRQKNIKRQSDRMFSTYEL